MNFQREKPVNLKAEEEKYFEGFYSRVIADPTCKEYLNVFIDSEFNLFKKFHFLEESFYLKKKPSQKWITRHKFIISSIAKKNIVNIDIGSWLTDIWSHNYFHWQVDFFQRYLILLESKSDFGTLILQSEYKKYPYIADSLSKLKCQVQYIEPESIIKVKHLHIPAFFWPPGAAHNELLKKVRNYIFERLELNGVNNKKRIYISRSNAPKRRIVNEDELILLLKKYDVETVKMEQLSWEEQVKLAYNSELVIGLHGAGMANMLYMVDGTVLELRMTGSYDQWCYYELSSALNHDYYYFFCSPSSENNDPYSGDIYVDLSQIKEVFNKILCHDHR